MKKIHQLTKKDKVKKKVASRTYKNVNKHRVKVFKSNLYTYAFLQNPKGYVIKGFTTKSEKGTKTEKAFAMGEKIGDFIKSKKVNDLFFNRSGYKYHGRIKAVAEGIRKSGVKI